MESVISEKDALVFVEGLSNFFSMNLPGEKFEVKEARKITPGEAPSFDITGIIGITGGQKGCVYFTADQDMFSEILQIMGEDEIDKDLLRDLAGEIANNIAGNASSHFSAAFQLSVPVVITGRPDSIYLPKDLYAFVIPVTWKHHVSNLVICIG